MDNEVIDIDNVGKQSHSLDPMDQFARSVSPSKYKRQQHINELLFKSMINEVNTHLARWVYESGISFNSTMMHFVSLLKLLVSLVLGMYFLLNIN